MIECSLGQQAVLICVDSYEGGVPRGRLYLPGQPGQRFDSLSQLLLRGEQLLELSGGAQSFTTARIFALAKPLHPVTQGSRCTATLPPSKCAFCSASTPAGRGSCCGWKRTPGRASAAYWS